MDTKIKEMTRIGNETYIIITQYFSNTPKLLRTNHLLLHNSLCFLQRRGALG